MVPSHSRLFSLANKKKKNGILCFHVLCHLHTLINTRCVKVTHTARGYYGSYVCFHLQTLCPLCHPQSSRSISAPPLRGASVTFKVTMSTPAGDSHISASVRVLSTEQGGAMFANLHSGQINNKSRHYIYIYI